MIFSKLSSLFTRMSSSHFLSVFLFCAFHKKHAMAAMDIEWYRMMITEVIQSPRRRLSGGSMSVKVVAPTTSSPSLSTWVKACSRKHIKQIIQTATAKRQTWSTSYTVSVFECLFLYEFVFSTYLRYILEYLKCWWPNMHVSLQGNFSLQARETLTWRRRSTMANWGGALNLP